MKKLKRDQLKKTFAGKILPDPIGPACGGSQCPDDNYRCCYHPVGNYCSTTACT
ncbi:hypothetical protein ODZ84_10275 [Chryseobacterium fluminis]|uniref:hypothetical protein n=1 Tax=Chryseobacterium fluminis TaxID=2983606 RepID=UPI002259E0CF|nr:hypothetical protein [Chryseobacterium sp. MMS21-Ot14]UZT99915.1 hypothetical protein ODZ84_10275 [Chryseobacterium sp. MMS21-Ot14]